MTGVGLIAVFLASIALLFFLILKLKWEPFLALLVATIFVGLVAGMPVLEVPAVMTEGFGSSLAGVGILIGLGVMFGQLLGSAGAIQAIAQALLRITGVKRAPTAVAFTGAIVSIPVFFDAAFIVLVNLIRSISVSAKISIMTLTTALAVGLAATHGLVAPTPGPIVVADQVGASLGLFIAYGLVVAVPAVLVAAIFYAQWVGRNKPVYDPATHGVAAKDLDGSEAEEDSGPKISTSRAMFLLALPIVIILVGAFVGLADIDHPIANAIEFIGDPNMGLLIGLLVTAVGVRPYLREKASVLYQKAIADGGLVILISGAGGAYGGMLNESGVGDYLVKTMTGWSIPILLLAFLFSQILRVSLGNTTLALITASTVLGPMAFELGASPILLGLAICAGGIGLSLPNDSGFWVVNKFSGLSVAETLKTWTVGGTIAGVTALGAVYVLSLFQGILPGI